MNCDSNADVMYVKHKLSCMQSLYQILFGGGKVEKTAISKTEKTAVSD